MRTRISVIAPVIIVLAIVALAVIIYLFVYKSRVNRALANGEGRDGAGPEPGSVGRSGLIIALIVIMAVSLIRIGNLNSKLDNANNMLTNQNSQIVGLRDQLQKLEDELNRQNSLIADYSVEFGAFDKQKQTAEIKVSVLPKEAGEDTSVVFKAGSHTVELERGASGTWFTGKFTAGLFERFDDEPLVIMTTGGISSSEELEYYELTDLSLHYIPVIMVSGGGQAEYSGGKLDLNWDVQLDFFTKSGTEEFVKEGIVLKIETGSQTEEKDISKDIEWNGTWGRYLISFDKKYELEKGQHFKVTVTAKDSLGYTHELVAADLTEDRPAAEEVYRIFDASGKQLK